MGKKRSVCKTSAFRSKTRVADSPALWHNAATHAGHLIMKQDRRFKGGEDYIPQLRYGPTQPKWGPIPENVIL